MSSNHTATPRVKHLPWEHREVRGCGELATRGLVHGVPALSWGWAPRGLLATERQLKARGLRPGSDPVAVLVFAHRKPARARDFAWLYLLTEARPKAEATPARMANLAAAMRARRTCHECDQAQDRCVSRTSRLCGPCEDRTQFWEYRSAVEFGDDYAGVLAA